MSKSRSARLLLALAVVGLAVGGSIARADTQADMARDLVPAQKPLYQLGGIEPGAAHGVDAWVDNPELVYRVGQQLKVFVRPKRTSYITVLNVGSSGKVSVIFPNFYQPQTRVRAGRTVAIPAEHAGWGIHVSGPPGVEVIKVIASHKPLALAELRRLASATPDDPILSLGRSGEAVARDLVPQLKPDDSGAPVSGVRSLLVRVLPRGAALPTPPFAPQKLTGGFGLRLRPERPIYRIGESVRVAVGVAEDCRLSLISVGTSGRAVRLFPNRYQSDGIVRAGQTVIVPSPRAPFELKARGPAGVEGLLATCRDIGETAPPARAAHAAGNFAAVDLSSATRDLVAAPAEDRVERVSSGFIVID